MSDRAYVFGYLPGTTAPELVGQVIVLETGNAGFCRFKYARSWLARPNAFAVDPDLRQKHGKGQLLGVPLDQDQEPSEERFVQQRVRGRLVERSDVRFRCFPLRDAGLLAACQQVALRGTTELIPKAY